jgi:hypothetical protein
MNNKGSSLQIVLVILCILLSSTTLFFSTLSNETKDINQIKIIEEQKKLEIALIHYYQRTLEDDILLSDDYEDDYIHVSYSVETDFDKYTIETIIKTDLYSYSFECVIEDENYQVISLKYDLET